ncbi:FRG domain-containing protein [Kluyvera sp. CRP]|uniref:FRG domain-containing protein n=1 Tax=Kluyvera sp. CRP TaxID=2873269 RepID=UPI001CC1DF1D|nr:FRG domain-containing protein [Kluyvera sp. CRP]UAK20223.1 FRG domain-containing protein [Kluyvera sp. CRP]
MDIESVSDFVKIALSWRNEGKSPTSFRGQKYSGWSMLPKLFRPDVRLYEHENYTVRDIVSIHPEEFSKDQTMFDRLVRMQHFDLPTRLLDVTINPLIALWFATEDFKKDRRLQDGLVYAYFVPESRKRYYDSDRVSCMSNLANLKIKDKSEVFEIISRDIGKDAFNKNKSVDQLLYHIKMEKSHFRDIINPYDLVHPIYVKPKMSNKRIIAQSGAFFLYGANGFKGTKPEEWIKREYVIIQAKHKKKIRKELESLGVHASSLFPEIDKTANFLIQKYQNDSAVTE